MTARLLKRGFTLVELLVVIAIIGVLAVVVVVAINPVQQLARTRDSGRKSGVTQIGHAMEAYATTHNGIYVDESGTWVTSLVTAGELSVVPSLIAYSITGISACTLPFAESGWCYDATTGTGGNPIIVFARLESLSSISLCTGGPDAAWFVWSTADGRGGTVCTTLPAIPTVSAGGQTFVD